jgi:hypothetical protein
MATTWTNWSFQLSERDATNLYTIGSKLFGAARKIIQVVDVSMLAMNIYNWQQTGWNPEYIIPVATSGVICTRNTPLYKSVITKMAEWTSGYRGHSSIRNLIKVGRNYAICQVAVSAGVIYGLSWNFNNTECVLNLPGELFNIGMYSLGIYGCNLMIRPESQERIINFIAETLAPVASDMNISATGSSQIRKPFDELVDTMTYTEPQSCPICMDDEKYELGCIKECQHKFCRECLLAWYRKPVGIFNCPLCRINLDTPIDNVPVIRNMITQLFNSALNLQI